MEMKDHQLPPSQESRLQQPGGGPSPLVSVSQPRGSSRVQLAAVDGRRKSHNSSQTGPRVKENPPHTNQEAVLQKSTGVDKYEKETQGTSQTVCVSGLSCSISKQDTVEESDKMMSVEGDLNPSEKPKRSKNRRRPAGCWFALFPVGSAAGPVVVPEGPATRRQLCSHWLVGGRCTCHPHLHLEPRGGGGTWDHSGCGGSV